MAKVRTGVWQKRWEAKSFTDPGTVYTVGLKVDGTYGCSCKAWIFQRKRLPEGHCKHINVILGKLRVQAQEAVTAETLRMLDEWAVEEVFSLPNLGMESFGERSI